MTTFAYHPDKATVQTTKGAVRGYVWHDIFVFKGIPYATAKRFHTPEEIKPWDGVKDATSFGYVCPLLSMDKPMGELLVPHRFWPMDEDCQNLNVWTPGLDSKRRPVLVWLHGGGYAAGSAIEHIAYEGENMARFGDAVVVTVNHRLNILGYLDLSAFGPEYENSGNAGGEDIIASLRWVHDNIEAFGGDPENVTVFGQSGGGGKVTTLLQSPDADGLYSKGFNMSGVLGTLIADEAQSGEEMVRSMMQETGVSTARELETVPYRALADAYNKLFPVFRKAGKYTGGRPHVNSHYLGEPCTHGFRKETAGIPLLVGSVFGEFASFGPFALDRSMSDAEAIEKLRELYGDAAAEKLPALFREAYPDRPLLDVINLDTIFRAPEIEYIRKRSALNACTWSYLFNQDMPIDGGRTPWHCSDIPFVFHNTAFTPYCQMEGEGLTETLENRIFDSVMAFARTGDPNHGLIPEWAASEPEKETTLIFDSHPRAAVNFDHRLIPAAAELRVPLHPQASQAQIQH